MPSTRVTNQVPKIKVEENWEDEADGDDESLSTYVEEEEDNYKDLEENFGKKKSAKRSRSTPTVSRTSPPKRAKIEAATKSASITDEAKAEAKEKRGAGDPVVVKEMIELVLNKFDLEIKNTLSEKYDVEKGRINKQWQNRTKPRVLKALASEFGWEDVKEEKEEKE